MEQLPYDRFRSHIKWSDYGLSPLTYKFGQLPWELRSLAAKAIRQHLTLIYRSNIPEIAVKFNESGIGSGVMYVWLEREPEAGP